MIARAVLAVALLLFAGGAATARDGGGVGRPFVCDMPTGPRLSACQDWISTMTRPDTGTSCCGQGDSYIADNFRNDPDGTLWAIISANYPDLTAESVDEDGNVTAAVHDLHVGDEVEIPPGKINNRPQDTNKSGHGVVFMMWANGKRTVICYRFPPLV